MYALKKWNFYKKWVEKWFRCGSTYGAYNVYTLLNSY